MFFTLVNSFLLVASWSIRFFICGNYMCCSLWCCISRNDHAEWNGIYSSEHLWEYFLCTLLVFLCGCERRKKDTWWSATSYHRQYVSAFVLDIISNASTGLAAEAIATHVLLAFHMLLFNILLLTLLIAVLTYVYWHRWSRSFQMWSDGIY